jgi:hypothetical protein
MKYQKNTFTIIFIFILNFSAMIAQAQPTDAQVLKDVVTDKKGLVDAYCSKTQKANRYWHSTDQAWYWDREMTIKRNAELAGAPNALVIVTGIARYEAGTSPFSYVRFLVTTNEYEGLKGMSTKDLESYVQNNPKEIFFSRLASVTSVGAVKAVAGAPWVWHTPTSFSVQFQVSYKQIVSVFDLADRMGIFEIRFYKQELNGPITGILAKEKSYEEKTTRHTEEAIRNMKTLGSN